MRLGNLCRSYSDCRCRVCRVAKRVAGGGRRTISLQLQARSDTIVKRPCWWWTRSDHRSGAAQQPRTSVAKGKHTSTHAAPIAHHCPPVWRVGGPGHRLALQLEAHLPLCAVHVLALALVSETSSRRQDARDWYRLRHRLRVLSYLSCGLADLQAPPNHNRECNLPLPGRVWRLLPARESLEASCPNATPQSLHGDPGMLVGCRLADAAPVDLNGVVPCRCALPGNAPASPDELRDRVHTQCVRPITPGGRNLEACADKACGGGGGVARLLAFWAAGWPTLAEVQDTIACTHLGDGVQ